MNIIALDSRKNKLTCVAKGSPDNPPPKAYDLFLFESMPLKPHPGTINEYEFKLTKDMPPVDSEDCIVYKIIPEPTYVPAVKVRFNDGFPSVELAIFRPPILANVQPVLPEYYPFACAGVTLANAKFANALSQEEKKQVLLRIKYWIEGGETQSKDFVVEPNDQDELPFVLLNRYLSWKMRKRLTWKDRRIEIIGMGYKEVLELERLKKTYSRMFVTPFRSSKKNKNKNGTKHP